MRDLPDFDFADPAQVIPLEELAFFRGIIVLAHLPGRLASVLAVVDHLHRDVAELLVL